MRASPRRRSTSWANGRARSVRRRRSDGNRGGRARTARPPFIDRRIHQGAGIAMSVVHQTQPASATVTKPQPPPRPRWLESKPFYRYGFMVLILVVWEIAGPFIDPIFFSYPSKIAAAFYELTASGDLPYYLGQSLQV